MGGWGLVSEIPGTSTGHTDIDVPAVDIAVSKAVDNATPNEGGTVNYTVIVTNNGPDGATGVEVTDLLPGGVTYVSDSPT